GGPDFDIVGKLVPPRPIDDEVCLIADWCNETRGTRNGDQHDESDIIRIHLCRDVKGYRKHEDRCSTVGGQFGEYIGHHVQSDDDADNAERTCDMHHVFSYTLYPPR